MLRRVENEPVMTVREMSEYYPDNWFRFVILDEASIDYPVEEALARVIFLADTEEELLRIPSEHRYEPGYPSGGDYWGVRVDPEPGIQIGGVEVGRLQRHKRNPGAFYYQAKT